MSNNAPLPGSSALFGLAARPAAPERVSPADATERIAAGTAILVDCRESDEWSDSGILAGAATLPLSDLQGRRTLWSDFLAANKDKQLLVYCLSGARSAAAARQLANQGFKSANAGGLHDWFAAGHRLIPYAP